MMLSRWLPSNRIYTACLLVGLIALAGCSSSTPNPTAPNYLGPLGPGGEVSLREGSILGDDGLTFGTSKSRQADAGGGGGLGVNAFLWRGALDTLSFMPLSSADPFGGVIITDWYQPPGADGERFKTNTYILGRELRADGVRVSLFRQVQKGSQWVDAPASPAVAGELENKILSRARTLRASSLPSSG